MWSVEGRADVLNLLKNNVKNAVAIGGTSVQKELIELTEGKKVTVFLDGDRGGDLILKKLKQLINIDNVIRAPEGKEVEELTKKEIYKLLRDKESHKTAEIVEKGLDDRIKEKIIDILDKMTGTRAAYVFDERMKMVGKTPLNRFTKKNSTLKDAKIVLVDGEITDDIARVADALNIDYLVGDSSAKIFKTKTTTIYTRSELTT
jgi:DNA primase